MHFVLYAVAIDAVVRDLSIEQENTEENPVGKIKRKQTTVHENRKGVETNAGEENTKNTSTVHAKLMGTRAHRATDSCCRGE